MSFEPPDGVGGKTNSVTVAIVASRYNQRFVNALLDNTLRALDDSGVQSDNVEVFRVPGSGEIPFAVARLQESSEYDVIIALGVIVRGDTPHFDILAMSTAQALQQANVLGSGVPIINGIITVNDEEQAQARTIGAINRGREFALSAIEMAILGQQFDESFGDDPFDEEGMSWLDPEDEDEWRS